jgi:hypothetical protein
VARRLALLALLLGFCACDGDSKGGAPFAGITQTYVVAGGNRRLELNGLNGTYSATTPGGTQVLPVSLGEEDLSIAARSVPYLAEGELIIGGGYAGFAVDSVFSDPRTAAGTYTTMTGANFAGELRIDDAGDYVWCMRSRIGENNACADGSTPNRGATSVQSPLGFRFAGVLGTYAIHRRGAAAAIFPVDAQSLRLMAFTQPLDAPRGPFSQPPASAAGRQVSTTVTFEQGSVRISGEPAWSGTYDYSVDAGVIRFASPQCPGNICNAIYSNDLGTLYVARLGNGLFIR